MALTFAYWTVAICISYLFFLLCQNRYRLLIPSIIHTSTWGITALIMILKIKGIFMSSTINENAFALSSEYMCYIVISSIVGFIIAHFVTQNKRHVTSDSIDSDVLEQILTKFKWIPYLCAIIGISLLIFITSVMGDIETFSNYREIAISTKKTGLIAIIQRISGHANILGSFYLMFLGYKMGLTGLDLKKFIITAILCSLINMSIGGRVWILSSTLPFFITFFLSRYSAEVDYFTKRTDKIKIFSIIISSICIFSVLGILRNDTSKSQTLMDKLCYFTDGMRMTNMVLSQYPAGSYDLEYGRSEFLYLWFDSPMASRFAESISHNLGLSVTVKSSLPYLYYDFGFIGGIIMWGLFCFILECICIQLISHKKIVGLLLFGILSQMLFQSPIFPIFSLYTPSLEWILVIYLFREQIFKKINDCKKHL